MRLICVDHFFEQDIEAMRATAGSRRCWSVSYEFFWRLAQRSFAEDVFTGIEAFFRPEYESDRKRYAEAATRELDDSRGSTASMQCSPLRTPSFGYAPSSRRASVSASRS